MRMNKGALVLLCAIALAEPASAVTWFDVDASQIQHIRADSREGLMGYYIQFTQVFPGDTGCSARDFAYIPVSTLPKDMLARDMYATALAAFTAGEKITIGTTGCDSIGNVIQALSMKKS